MGATASHAPSPTARLPAVVPGTRALVLACLALACLSLLGPFAMSYDPWGWLVWGREVTQLSLDTTGGPSWKPLPVLFTTALAPLGDAAPTLWMILARAGGLLGLVAAFRLATRCAGPTAGVVACLALLLTPDDAVGWVRNMVQGNIEPLLIALCLWAVERHLDSHRGQALGLGVLAALARPEVWPFLGLYAAGLWWKDPRARWLVAVLVPLVPLLWFGGDWWGSGDPLTGGNRARVVEEDDELVAQALQRGLEAVILPVWLAALSVVALAVRRRERLVPALGVGALGWIALVVGTTVLFDFAALPRFYAPAAALLSVLAAIGLVRLVRAPARLPARVALGVALVAVTAPFALSRLIALQTQPIRASSQAPLQADLGVALGRAGGPSAVAGCGALAIDVSYHSAQPALAWALGVPMDRVERRIGEQPGVVFALAGHSRAQRLAASPRARPLARTERWSVFAVECQRRPGH